MFLALLLAGCGPDGSSVLLPDGPPDARGPHAIGTAEDEVPGEPDLPLQLWYPTHSTGAERAAFDAAPGLGTAQADVPPDCEGPRPVVLFSHGNGGLRYQSVFLTEHLAGQGFLVAAPDHVGNTLFDSSLPRGEVAVRRPLDVRASFDHLVQRSADPEDPLAGCVDGAAGYAVVGHSFGAWTTLVVAGAEPDLAGLAAHCEQGSDFFCGLEAAWEGPTDSGSDPRVWAAVPISPAGARSLGDGLAASAVPTLVIGGLLDTLTPWDEEIRPVYDGLGAPERALAGLEETGHFAFTDFCLDGIFPNCGDDVLPLETVHRITGGLVVSWLRAQLGVDGAVLPPLDDEVRWTVPD